MMTHRLTKYILNDLREFRPGNYGGNEKIRAEWYKQDPKMRRKSLKQAADKAVKQWRNNWYEKVFNK